MDLIAIREAMAGRIKTAVGDVANVLPFSSSTPPLPAVVIDAASDHITYIETLSPGHPAAEVRLVVTVYMPIGLDIDGQRKLARMMSHGKGQAHSIRDALTADRTLSGACQSLVCEAWVNLDRELIAPPDGQTPCDAAQLSVVLVPAQ